MITDQPRDPVTGRLLPLPPPRPAEGSPEQKLDIILTRYGLLSHEIDLIPNAADRNTAHMLAMSIKAIADQARAKLRAIALANLKRGQDKRRETQPARTAAHREKQMARVRLALAQSNGNKAAATRLLGCGRPFLENYKRLIDEEDAAKPAARCPTCQQQMPILDSGRP